MTEEQRKERNAQRLTECNPIFRRKVAAILSDLEGHGWRPRIQEAWRSPARQKQLLADGFTKVRWGMHNATTEDGNPDSLAVDILDDGQPNKESSKFLLMLAASAKSHGCVTGIAWGLGQEDRDTIRSAIASRDFEAKVEIGWDPCHVQIGGISVREARNGTRP
ncbi:hypothetical protein [Armatimonas sp.]|uniref:hypothetical protein n=1 Tax=Armatimonas sp. TaxID=1872638 RepID=UPI00286ADEB7|nr:hypothetical protein [Armatimonas sp.]